MARKWRVEYPGAVYHVINRGNYRAWVFREEGARDAFEACLREAAERYGWVLHAWVVMSNHFHLALETPAGNLVAGMQWLQSVYANRFNRYRGENGQLFQGRYKALLVEKGTALGQVCDYIHLNPVRARMITVEALGNYGHGSYRFLARPKARPAYLDVADFLMQAGGLADTPAGWRCYADYMAWQAAEGPAGRNQAYVNLTRGWALGTEEFKATALREQLVPKDHHAWTAADCREERSLRWRVVLDQCLSSLGCQCAPGDSKSAAWKVAIATHLRQTMGVPNGWLAEHLEMGSAFYVSKHVGLARNADHPAAELLLQLRKVKGKG
ncbi:transposase [Opitutus sp. ER46]|uniref:transposase n=1 Tax=Opitutus sp. ER46 TaxID=2161864 RepID=UPI000D316F93|nr:transposase [Opitutus sp. ER46]PTX95462.1 transposase [Opitutus sp. ER46]